MLPLLIAGIVLISVGVGVAIAAGPTRENNTLIDVRAHLKREAELIHNEQCARDLREENKRYKAQLKRNIEMLEAEKNRREKVIREMAPREMAPKKKYPVVAELDKKQQKERREQEERRKQDQELKLVRQAAQKAKQELMEQIANLKQREQQFQHKVFTATQLAEEGHTARLKAGGHGPLCWPTAVQFEHALRTTRYSPNYFHFAIVGRAGSGKSSLINAFRNLRNKDPGAAETGTKETTLRLARYPDPGKVPPRKWMVWFDVQGLGRIASRIRITLLRRICISLM